MGKIYAQSQNDRDRTAATIQVVENSPIGKSRDRRKRNVSTGGRTGTIYKGPFAVSILPNDEDVTEIVVSAGPIYIGIDTISFAENNEFTYSGLSQNTYYFFCLTTYYDSGWNTKLEAIQYRPTDITWPSQGPSGIGENDTVVNLFRTILGTFKMSQETTVDSVTTPAVPTNWTQYHYGQINVPRIS